MKKNLIILLLFCVISALTYGQMSTGYSIGGIILGDNNYAQLGYGFVKSGKCYTVSSGIEVVNIRESEKKFALTCIEPTQDDFLSTIYATPNPVSKGTVLRSPFKQPGISFLKIGIQIINSSGQVMSYKEVFTENLMYGIPVDLSMCLTGTYLLRLNYQNQVKTLKIIKY